MVDTSGSFFAHLPDRFNIVILAELIGILRFMVFLSRYRQSQTVLYMTVLLEQLEHHSKSFLISNVLMMREIWREGYYPRNMDCLDN